MNYLIGIIEDNVGLLVFSHFAKTFPFGVFSQINYPFGYRFDLFGSNQPFFEYPFFFFSTRFDEIFVYNSFVIVALVLAFICSFRFFNYFLSSKAVSFLCSLLFLFSPYFMYKSQSHLDLLQVWILVLYICLLVKAESKLDYFVSGLILAVTLLISNYLGYFGLIFTCLYLFFISFGKNGAFLKSVFFHGLILLGSFVALCSISLFPFLKLSKNGFSETSLVVPNRAMEDFFTFTSRPWYYFLPSVDNPFLGNVSKKAHDFLANDWGYWLTSNYFKKEHSISFLGWSTFLVAFLGFLHTQKKKNLLDISPDIRRKTRVLFFVAVSLFLLTMPPFFTISMKKIYMPSYVLWKLFPMFRVLSRMGVLVLLIELIFVGFGYNFLYKWVNAKLKTKATTAKISIFLSSLLITLIFILGLCEFIVPVRISKVDAPPDVYEYIKKNTPETSVIAVFPYNKTNEAVFWLRKYNRNLINPHQIENLPNSFFSEDFTLNLVTIFGIDYARKLGMTHLVYFADADKNRIANEEFFGTIPSIREVASFSSPNDRKIDLGFANKFVSLTNEGDNRENGAILYEVISAPLEN